jgi:hypothetical protein
MQQIIKKVGNSNVPGFNATTTFTPFVLLKEGLLMTYLVAHFSALGVSNFVTVCVCVGHLSFDFALVNSDFQSCDFS